MKQPFADASMKQTRRRFLGETGCAAMSSISMVNMMLNLRLATSAAAQGVPTDRKTLVCIFLNGGMDSFNVLVPRDDTRYGNYATSRGNLALDRSSLKTLNQIAGSDGNLYGLHPSCGGFQDLFNGLGGDTSKRRLAMISNIGTLIQPTTKAQYVAGNAPLPRALFSHADQIDQWQTSVPQGMAQVSGWFGRAADILHGSANSGATAMNISLSGNNLIQVGNNTQQFVITDSGALALSQPTDSNPANPGAWKNSGHRSLLAQHYSNLMQESYSQLTKTSMDLQENFQTIFRAYDDSAISSLFPDTYFGGQMLAAAKTIAIRQSLGLHRQTIFLTFGGWDHHDELLKNEAGMLAVLSGGLTGFQKALEALGLQNDVITFTASDFARTLRSNGRGTDHAWGGNNFVMGGPVQGGKIYGTFPDVTLDSNDDVGYGGRMMPTTSVDQFFGELLRWFGVSSADLSYVLPNITNFYSVNSSTLPIGFLRPGTWS
jgi:uncharacterized protein (DUF1501 family)